MMTEDTLDLNASEVERLRAALALDAVGDGQTKIKQNMLDTAAAILKEHGIKGLPKSVDVDYIGYQYTRYTLRFDRVS
jgi:hypothetical protein